MARGSAKTVHFSGNDHEALERLRETAQAERGLVLTQPDAARACVQLVAMRFETEQERILDDLVQLRIKGVA